MRVTVLSPPPNLFGGERVLAIYTRELIRLGHSVEIVCYRKQPTSLKKRIAEQFRSTANSDARRTSDSDSHYKNYGVPFRIASRAGVIDDRDVNDADVVLASFWKTARWAHRLSARKGVPTYLIQHDEGSFHGPDAEATYRLPMKHIYVSKWIADRIKARHLLAEGKTIPNAVDHSVFDCGPRQTPSEKWFGVMWSPDFQKKGTDTAIDAFRRAKRAMPSIKLLAYGATQPTGHEAEFDKFFYRPDSSTLATLYQSCIAWLFPSRFEGFGLPIVESLAARTPVIGTPTGAGTQFLTGPGSEL
ncbi:MAG: glycosyltransferase family 4 protein, partial [Planctomycetota bacterium]